MIVVVVVSSVLELNDGLAVMDEAKTSVMGAVEPGVVKAATAMSGMTDFEHGVSSS